jgi:hypothetical protein
MVAFIYIVKSVGARKNVHSRYERGRHRQRLLIVMVRVPQFDHDSKAASTTIREDESELNRHLL